MEHQKAGAQINARAFIQSVVILLVLMIAAGILTRVIPAGVYQRVEVDGLEMIDPASFQSVPQPNYPVWRWFTAPLEVLAGPDSATIIIIILFLLMVGAAFAVLDKSGMLLAVVARLVQKFEGRKYLLLLAISLFFMLIGAFFGIFEEVVPLIPLMLALSYYLGWDALVGLGMSILAVNIGFSAAVTNPFTIGVAQKLATLPLFSGASLRVVIFVVIYAIFAAFLSRYARKIERNPHASPVYVEDQAERKRYAHVRFDSLLQENPGSAKAMMIFLVFLALILLLLFASPFVPALASISLPLVGVLFLVGGISASLAAGAKGAAVWQAVREGLAGIAPAIPLILMAASVKHIVVQGQILDTILSRASASFNQTSPYLAALFIYVLALLMEFFVGSGSAKAFLLMPILLPLADLVNVTRQVAVTAYCFGDGFSNLAYPTNPVLLISLGLTTVAYSKWLRWTLALWFWVILATVLFLMLGVAIGYGPF